MTEKPTSPNKTDNPYRAAIFDLGGVVIRFDIERIGKSWAKSAGVDEEELRNKEFFSDALGTTFHDFERGQIEPQEFYRVITDRLGLSMTCEQFFHGWCDIYLGTYPGIGDLLAELKKHVRVVALSNTNITHTNFWSDLYPNVLKNFEKVFVSHDIGARKPEPDCYQAPLEYLQIPPEQAIFIDDSQENIQAAEKLGMTGILADETGVPKTIALLRQLGIDV